MTDPTAAFLSIECAIQYKRITTVRISFKSIAQVSALTCFALAIVWSVFPELLLSIWSVEFSGSTGLVCRRAAALFAGLGIMLFKLRDASPSPIRSAVTTGFVVACSLLALSGMIEFAIGHAGPGILLAVAVEIVLALGFHLADRPEVTASIAPM